jgi:hypothetical protein
VADVEVLEAALGLRAPIPVGRNLDIAKTVEFASQASRVQANWYVKDGWFSLLVVTAMGHSSDPLLRVV